MKAGEIYLGMFPFGDAPGMKLRPVLLLTGPTGNIPEILVAYISSVVPAKLLPSDILIDPSQAKHLATKLKVISVLRLHKIATIHQSSVVRRFGKNLQRNAIRRGKQAARVAIAVVDQLSASLIARIAPINRFSTADG